MLSITQVFLLLVAVFACTSPDGAYDLTALADNFHATFPGEDAVSPFVGDRNWYINPCGTTFTACGSAFSNDTAVCERDVSPSLIYTTSGRASTAVWFNATDILGRQSFGITYQGGDACGDNSSATIYFVCNETADSYNSAYGEDIGLSVVDVQACSVTLMWESHLVCGAIPSLTTTTGATSTTTGTGATLPPSETSGGDGSGGGAPVAGVVGGVLGAVVLACAGCVVVVLVVLCVVCLLMCVVAVLLLAVVAAAACVSSLGAAAGAVLLRRRRKHVRPGMHKILDLPALPEEGFRTIEYEDLEFGLKIGEGAFGKVYKGTWEGVDVALKVVKDIDTDAMEDIMREANLMTHLGNHLNVVQFLGVSRDPDGQVVLVTKFYGNGSLHSLFMEKRVECEESDLYNIAWDIAVGLAFLHKNNVVHRDVAARNCLMGVDNRVVISDFGTSRLVEKGTNSNTTKTDIGPVRWMAPESLKNREYSPASDVWMYGVTLWELVARDIPYGETPVIDVWARVQAEDLALEVPSDAPPVLAEVINMCLQFDPDERATLKEVMDALRPHVTVADDSSLLFETARRHHAPAAPSNATPHDVGYKLEQQEITASAKNRAALGTAYVVPRDVPGEQE